MLPAFAMIINNGKNFNMYEYTIHAHDDDEENNDEEDVKEGKE